MARRLFVVLAQSPHSSPACRQLEEQLVTELIMESGVEMNVVPHLADLPSDATGMLCLEGIPGDMVLLSWLPDAAARGYLEDYGVRGRYGRTRFHESPPTTEGPSGNGVASNGEPLPARAIYTLNLQGAESTEPLLAEIRRIRDDRSVQTFQLSGLGIAPLAVIASPAPPSTNGRPVPAAPPAPARNNGERRESTPGNRVSETRSGNGTSRSSNASPAGRSAASSAASAGPGVEAIEADPRPSVPSAEELEDAALDRLVDQLDELDI
jgi:hypothetical protein